METLKKEILIPADHHLMLDFNLPATIPAGKAEVLLIFQSMFPADIVKKKKHKPFTSIKLNTSEFQFNREHAHER